MVSITGPCCGERPYNSSPNMDVWCAHIPQWLDQQAVWWRNDSRPGTISLHALQRAAPSLARLLVLDSWSFVLLPRFTQYAGIAAQTASQDCVAEMRAEYDARRTILVEGHSAGLEMQGSLPLSPTHEDWVELSRGFCGVATRPWLQCVRFGAVVVHTGLLWSWECLHDFVKDWRRYRAWNCWELGASFILKSWDVRKLIWSLQLDVFIFLPLQVIDSPFSWYAVPTRNCSKNHPKVIGGQYFRFMNKWGPKHDGNPVRCGFFASAQWWRILLCSLTLQQILRRFLIDHETYIYIYIYINSILMASRGNLTAEHWWIVGRKRRHEFRRKQTWKLKVFWTSGDNIPCIGRTVFHWKWETLLSSLLPQASRLQGPSPKIGCDP